jgi:hypothetical protein
MQRIEHHLGEIVHISRADAGDEPWVIGPPHGSLLAWLDCQDGHS